MGAGLSVGDERLREVAEQLFDALLAIMDELGGEEDWDANVEVLFSRGILQQGLDALTAARGEG
ncbi:MAG TPA: hypothetical protein VI759_03515 [Dehalococcoidia bacterium]|nr:hypothetical protein [Dehalococcoidia bacterium]